MCKVSKHLFLELLLDVTFIATVKSVFVCTLRCVHVKHAHHFSVLYSHHPLGLIHSPNSLRLIWPGLNGGVLCGKGPPHRPSFSLWPRRTLSCVVSADAWQPMCWACGEGTTPLDAESFGFSGGGMTPVLLSLSTMSSRVSAFLCPQCYIQS